MLMNHTPNPISSEVYQALIKIRTDAPLIHNITNTVVMNTTANALLALGASPVMAHAEEELREMVGISNALVLNIGTLDANWVASMFSAATHAKEFKIPVVLDPVGVGATSFRTQVARKLLESRAISVVRGNASEILALSGSTHHPKGVETQNTTEDAWGAAQTLAAESGATISISGSIDTIVHGRRNARIHNGHHWMTKVTGMGCIASALTGAFLAIEQDSFKASIYAMSIMGVVGERAAENASGPGTFLPDFLDVLFNLDLETLNRRLRVEIQ